jgi:16S rRNA (guanine(966)-N(2))-methyltransferase RsmD
VPGTSTRPITDRVKEALFNIIGSDIQDSVFLDLFAGTGSVGVEALSRGAVSAVFLEIDRQAIATVHANLESTGLASRAEVHKVDSFLIIFISLPRNTRDCGIRS